MTSTRHNFPPYKTKICNNWRSGNCAYGRECHFAHGPNELRGVPSTQSYSISKYSKRSRSRSKYKYRSRSRSKSGSRYDKKSKYRSSHTRYHSRSRDRKEKNRCEANKRDGKHRDRDDRELGKRASTHHHSRRFRSRSRSNSRGQFYSKQPSKGDIRYSKPKSRSKTRDNKERNKKHQRKENNQHERNKSKEKQRKTSDNKNRSRSGDSRVTKERKKDHIRKHDPLEIKKRNDKDKDIQKENRDEHEAASREEEIQVKVKRGEKEHLDDDDDDNESEFDEMEEYIKDVSNRQNEKFQEFLINRDIRKYNSRLKSLSIDSKERLFLATNTRVGFKKLMIFASVDKCDRKKFKFYKEEPNYVAGSESSSGASSGHSVNERARSWENKRQELTFGPDE